MRIIKKKRFILTTLDIEGPERQRKFEIVLPANITRVSDIIVTAFNATQQTRLGIITLQALNACDIFLKHELFSDGEVIASELATELKEPGFEEDKAYVTGRVPKPIEVNVEGDIGVLYGWYVTDEVNTSYSVNIYVIYEEAEKLEQDGK